MPRRNSSVIEKKREFHGATQYHSGYRKDCAVCPFVGVNFSCITSDGKCLKAPKRKKKKSKRRIPSAKQAPQDVYAKQAY